MSSHTEFNEPSAKKLHIQKSIKKPTECIQRRTIHTWIPSILPITPKASWVSLFSL